MPDISELIGSTKSASDLQSTQVRVRYTESQTISGNGSSKVILRFPKIPGKSLDMKSIRLSGTISLTGDSHFDAYSYSSILSRVRLLSSSNVLLDITEYGTLATTLEQLQTNVYSDNGTTRKNAGLFTGPSEAMTAAVTGPKRFSFPFIESILNCNALLPVDRLNGYLSLELYFADSKKLLYSATNSITSSYNISDLQILCDYIESPSLTNFFASTPVAFHVNNWSHRYQSVFENRSVLKIPSAYSSLNKLLILSRNNATAVL